MPQKLWRVMKTEVFRETRSRRAVWLVVVTAMIPDVTCTCRKLSICETGRRTTSNIIRTCSIVTRSSTVQNKMYSTDTGVTLCHVKYVIIFTSRRLWSEFEATHHLECQHACLTLPLDNIHIRYCDLCSNYIHRDCLAVTTIIMQLQMSKWGLGSQGPPIYICMMNRPDAIDTLGYRVYSLRYKFLVLCDKFWESA